MAGRNILLVDKRQKKATVIGKATPNDSNIKKEEQEKLKKKGYIQKAEGQSREDMVSECNSGASGNQSTWGCDLQKLQDCLQCIPGRNSEISFQRNDILNAS